MNRNQNRNSGYSIIEILVVIAILGIILTIGTVSFESLRSKKQLQITVDSISTKLEEAKTNAVADKGGLNYGIYLQPTSYTLFSGNTYNPNSGTNSSTTIPTNILISKILSNGGDAIVFSRITGSPQATGTIVISGSSGVATVTVGTLGDINVLK